MRVSALPLLILIILSPFSLTVNAAEGDRIFGIYANVFGVSGKPSGDVLGIGFMTNYQLKNLWFLDIELIQTEADFDNPLKVLELAQDESITSTATAVYNSTIVMLRLGKTIKTSNPSFDGYWSTGLGVNTIDVDTITGPLLEGESFKVSTDAKTETIIGLNAGIRQHLNDDWDINYALRVNYHFADWTVKDIVSSTSKNIDNYILYGVLIGVERRF